MYSINPLKASDYRSLWIAVFVGIGFVLLIGKLWYVQVISFEEYEGYREIQSYRIMREPAIRGKILDRNGIPLADNRPNYSIVLYLEELRPLFQSTFKTARAKHGTLSISDRNRLGALNRYSVVSNIWVQVTSLVGRPMKLHRRNFERHYDNDRYVPLTISENLTRDQVARFVEKGAHIPGVDLELESLRYYPNGTMASHLLGYARKTDPKKKEGGRKFNYSRQDYVGKKGVEAIYDDVLRGVAGEKAVLINNMMFRQREDVWDVAKPGNNLYLTLDLRIQRIAESALAGSGPNTMGAVVVMDVRNGDVLALASSPTYDPNEFVRILSKNRWEELNLEPNLPLLNRATYGIYAPGSIFKLVVGMALLEEGGVDPDELYSSLGYFLLGGRYIDDTAAPGDYDFRRALAKSSNSYFINYGIEMGIDPLIDWGERFFLGQKTGLLPGQELPGMYPSRADVRKGWHKGETANLCIGQGAIAVTPLQMAVMVSAVANGGTVFEPRIAARIEPQASLANNEARVFPEGVARGNIGVSERVLKIVHEGMLMDVEWDEGTGVDARVAGLSIGGKTGSAETDKRIDGRKIKDTWFASFAPVEDPRYAVVVLVVDGISGGTSCAPVAQQIYEVLQDLPESLEVSHQGPSLANVRYSNDSF